MTDFDIAAEQALLGCCLLRPELGMPALASVPMTAWWRQVHGSLAAVLTDMHATDKPIDPQTVLSELLARNLTNRLDGPYLHTLVRCAWQPEHAGAYAGRVRECAARRQLDHAAQRLTHRWAAEADHADEYPVAAAVADLRTACEVSEDLAAPMAAPEPTTVTELLAETDEHDWLIPGLLERGERVILTGSEGTGKSMMTQQIATGLAAGVHPFTGLQVPTCRVLVVDCELSRRQARPRYRRLHALAENLRRRREDPPDSWADGLHVEFRPEGVDAPGEDHGWLARLVAASAPDLLVIGPIYKLHRSNINDEITARELVHVLDTLRVQHNTALLMEAHAGHAEDTRGRRKLRPAGSSLFLRWPEFGLGMTRSTQDDSRAEHPQLVDVISWRGAREDRAWPRQLARGGPTRWPWMPHGHDTSTSQQALI